MALDWIEIALSLVNRLPGAGVTGQKTLSSVYTTSFSQFQHLGT